MKCRYIKFFFNKIIAKRRHIFGIKKKSKRFLINENVQQSMNKKILYEYESLNIYIDY